MRCVECDKFHMNYGMEAEIQAIEDEDARHAILGELNRDEEYDPHTAKYGIDGSDEPLEIRHINADNIRSLSENYRKTLSNLLRGIRNFHRKNPGYDKFLGTKECGIHIHQFHPGIKRERIIIANTLVAVMVNSLEPSAWASRLSHDYGRPFAARKVRWCESGHATELRTFNVLHPETLEACLELTSELMKLRREFSILPNAYEEKRECEICNDAECDDDEQVGNHLHRQFAHFQRENKFDYGDMKRFTLGALKFFVDKEIVTPPEIASIHKRVVKAYRPIFRGVRERIEFSVDEKSVSVPKKSRAIKRKMEVE